MKGTGGWRPAPAWLRSCGQLRRRSRKLHKRAAALMRHRVVSKRS